MIKVIFNIFIILHGLVHLLYFGQSSRYFELQPGMVWPDGSWIFSKLFGDGAVRILVSVALVVVAVGFVVGGLGLFVKQDWWRPLIVGSAVFSTVIYILFWDGKWQQMPDKGLIGVLIDVAILVAVSKYHLPK